LDLLKALAAPFLRGIPAIFIFPLLFILAFPSNEVVVEVVLVLLAVFIVVI
jgi:hypothetical protein